MNTVYRATKAMQPNPSSTKRRAMAGLLALAAAGVVTNVLVQQNPAVIVTPAQRSMLDAGDSFATVQGTGARVLHEFVSVDCSFCRKAEPELQRVGNVTIYRHLIPGHSDKARVQAMGIICGSDPAEAWRHAMQGDAHAGASCDSRALDRNYALGKEIGITGTPALVFPNGRVHVGFVTSDQVEEMLTAR